MANTLLSKSIFKYGILSVLAIILLLTYHYFDIDLINNIVEYGNNDVYRSTIYFGLIIFFLRSLSIVIPVIPGTYCSVIAGYIYGIKYGLLIIFIADLISCSSSFLIARRLGRVYLKKLLGLKQMNRVEKISKEYLEGNLFLMMGLLMTSWFDFVCYAVGLTKISWNKFFPALVCSILISDIPFVAAGYTLNGLKEVSINKIINGELKVLEGPYLLILIGSALLIFGLAIINILINKNTQIKA